MHYSLKQYQENMTKDPTSVQSVEHKNYIGITGITEEGDASIIRGMAPSIWHGKFMFGFLTSGATLKGEENPHFPERYPQRETWASLCPVPEKDSEPSEDRVLNI